MSANWKAGDKAVCVDDSPGLGFNEHSFPNGYVKKGTIYLVSEVSCRSERYQPEFRGKPCLIIAGIPAINKFGEVTGWRVDRFRKVVTATEREEAGMARLMEDLA